MPQLTSVKDIRNKRFLFSVKYLDECLKGNDTQHICIVIDISFEGIENN